MSGRTLAGVVTGAVAAAVVAGLLAIGSPAAARERRLDERRVEDLRWIGNAIDAHWSQNGVLPKTLNEIEPQLEPGVSVSDPTTKQPYEYRVIGDDRYELCAVFHQPSRSQVGLWSHPSSHHCFKQRSR